MTRTELGPLPHNKEAECSVLGAILLGGDLSDVHAQRLQPSDFFLPQHQLIYKAMLGLKRAGKPAGDIVLLMESMSATELESAGGLAYLSQLADALPRVTNFDHYAEIVSVKSQLRRKASVAYTCLDMLMGANGNGSEVIRDVSALSAPLREEVAQKRIIGFRTGAELALVKEQEIAWIAMGLWAKGAITELGAKVKAGKTTLVSAMVRAVLEGVAFLGQPTMRTPVVYLTEQPAVSFRQAMERADLLGRDDFIVLPHSETRGLKWPEIAAAATQECKRVGAFAVVVDTLPQFAGLVGDSENNSGDALAAMQPVQQMAAEGIGIILVRHERKSGGDVGDSGRGSSAFAGAVDIVLSLRKPEGNAAKTRRLIQSLSRFSETPSDLLIDLTDDGYIALGEPHDAAVKDAKEAILTIAPKTESEAVDLKELATNADVSRRTAQRAVDELLGEGMLSRNGAGKRGNPFRYFLPEKPFCATSSIGGAESRIQDSSFWPEEFDAAPRVSSAGQ